MTVPYDKWLNQLLPIGDQGCVNEACVATDGQMFLISPTANNNVYALARLPWTFEEWLWRWIRGERLVV